MVIGGVLAAFVFSFLQGLESLQYPFYVDVTLSLLSMVVIYGVVVLLGFFFYSIEKDSPSPEVALTENDVDRIVSRTVGELKQDET